MEKLRRLLPILLVAVLVMPLFAPLLALGQSAESALPACCRRNGKHHCAMGMAGRSQLAASGAPDRWTAPPERCPYCPASVATAHVQETLIPAPAQAFSAQGLSDPSGTVQSECKRRISRDRSRQKRGPPIFHG